MKRFVFPLLAAALATTLLISGCTQAAPTPTPAPAAKAAEPTKATAPAPTKVAEPAKAAEAPAKTTDFPVKGKAISILVGLPAGSSMDIGARVLAPMLEKDLGTPLQVVNKVGAGGQVALTELALAKPDGYTIATHALPATISMYIDAERKTAFSRKQLMPLALDNLEPNIIAVKADSPYKTLKELVDAAKANPGKIRASVSGVLVTPHLAALEFERVTGVKFGIVHFEGGTQGLTAMMGDHVDVDFGFPGTDMPMIKGGQIRILGVMDSKEYSLLPGVKTVESQGYKAYMSAYRGYVAPAGTPKEVGDLLSAAIKKAAASDDYAKKMAELGIEVRFMDGAQTSTYWADSEAQVKALVDMYKKQ